MAILTVNTNQGSGEGTDVDIALLICPQPVIPVDVRLEIVGEIKAGLESAFGVQYLDTGPRVVQNVDMIVADRDIRRVVECSYAGAVMVFAKPVQDFAGKVKHKNQITGTVDEVEPARLAIDGNALRTFILVFAFVVPDVAHEIAVAIKH